MARRKTYKIERIFDFGQGKVRIPVFETDDKREFFEQQDEMITTFGAGSVVKATTKTVTMQY